MTNIEKDLHEQLAKTSELTHLLAADVIQSTELLGQTFRETLGIDYRRLAHKAYEGKLRGVEGLINRVCESLKTVTYDGSQNDHESEYEISLGTKLFELYLAMQKFGQCGASQNDEVDEGFYGRLRPSGSDSGNESSAGSEDTVESVMRTIALTYVM